MCTIPMSENVIKFEPREVGAGYRIDPDHVLEAAKGLNLDRLMIIGELPDGELYVAGNANAGECMILMELAKRKIVAG